MTAKLTRKNIFPFCVGAAALVFIAWLLYHGVRLLISMDTAHYGILIVIVTVVAMFVRVSLLVGTLMRRVDAMEMHGRNHNTALTAHNSALQIQEQLMRDVDSRLHSLGKIANNQTETARMLNDKTDALADAIKELNPGRDL